VREGLEVLIGFLGDLHGHVLEALAATATWQRIHQRRFDFLVQVGDMGAYPDLDRVDEATDAHLAVDPSEADFARLLQANGNLAAAARRIRRELATPIHFVRGNHEDFAWLASLPVDTTTGTAPVDPFDLFRYVPDGRVLTIGSTRLAFLGGVEERDDAAGIDRDVHTGLMALGAGEVDVLITHQGPYGSSTGFRGDVHGSRLITELIERLRPSFHLAGHAHQAIGPVQYGRTTYLGLDGLTPSRRWQPEAQGLQPRSMAVLDAETGTLAAVTDDWLARFVTPFDFASWCDEHLRES
jgi:Icc-related predicted phosphoesterase